MYAKTIVLLVVSLLLASCAGGPSRLKSRLDMVPEAQRGYVVGTYSISCVMHGDQCGQVFNSISAEYRMATDHALHNALYWTYGSVFGHDTTHDYVNAVEGHKGFHFCIALPPGDFEFYSIGFFNFARGGSGYSLRSDDYFSIRFVVKPGEVVDIGTIRVTTEKGRNFFGMPLPAPGMMLLSESRNAETDAARAKCPEAAQKIPIARRFLTIPEGKTTPFVAKASP